MLNQYRELIKGWITEGESPTINAVNEEFKISLKWIARFFNS